MPLGGVNGYHVVRRQGLVFTAVLANYLLPSSTLLQLPLSRLATLADHRVQRLDDRACIPAMLGLHLMERRSRDRQDNGVTSRTRSALHTHGHAGPTRACTRVGCLRQQPAPRR